MKSKKGQISSLGSSILILVIAGIFLVLGIIIISETNDTLDNQSNDQTETILANANSAQTLSFLPSTWTSATVKNQTWLEFDGVDDKVETAYYPSNETRQYTFLGWIYRANNDGVDTIFGGVGSSKNYFLRMASDDGFDFWSANSGAVALGNFGEEDQWQHFALTFNQDDDDARLYDDGVEHVNQTLTDDFNETDSGYLSLGLRNQGDWWNGSQDEFMTFERELTRHEIELIYNESRYSFDKGLRVPELTFHYFNDTGGELDNEYTINTSMLRDILQIVNQSDITLVTYEEFGDWQNGKFTMPEKPLMIMIDDAKYDLYLAKAVFDEFGYTAGFGVITQTGVGSATYLSWENITEFINAGWEIASHSTRHQSHTLNLNSTSARATDYQTSRDEIIANTSTTPKVWVYPFNEQNITTRTECLTYYEVCTGDSKTTLTSLEPNYRDDSMTTFGIRRFSVRNYTTLSDIEDVIDWKNGLVIQLKLNENTGLTAFDSSSNGNNGTITGATWANDGVDNTLTDDVDYNQTGTTFTILNSEYSWSQINASYIYETFGAVKSNINNTVSGLGTFADFWEIIILAIVITIVIGMLLVIPSIGGNKR